MKTFIRRPRGNESPELTNGTSERKQLSLTGTNDKKLAHIKVSDDTRAQRAIRALEPGDGRKKATGCELSEPGNKRKLNEDVVCFRRKAARVESSPVDTEQRIGTPVREGRFPAITSASPSPHSRSSLPRTAGKASPEAAPKFFWQQLGVVDPQPASLQRPKSPPPPPQQLPQPPPQQLQQQLLQRSSEPQQSQQQRLQQQPQLIGLAGLSASGDPRGGGDSSNIGGSSPSLAPGQPSIGRSLFSRARYQGGGAQRCIAPSPVGKASPATPSPPPQARDASAAATAKGGIDAIRAPGAAAIPRPRSTPIRGPAAAAATASEGTQMPLGQALTKADQPAITPDPSKKPPAGPLSIRGAPSLGDAAAAAAVDELPAGPGSRPVGRCPPAEMAVHSLRRTHSATLTPPPQQLQQPPSRQLPLECRSGSESLEAVAAAQLSGAAAAASAAAPAAVGGAAPPAMLRPGSEPTLGHAFPPRTHSKTSALLRPVDQIAGRHAPGAVAVAAAADTSAAATAAAATIRNATAGATAAAAAAAAAPVNTGGTNRAGRPIGRGRLPTALAETEAEVGPQRPRLRSVAAAGGGTRVSPSAAAGGGSIGPSAAAAATAAAAANMTPRKSTLTLASGPGVRGGAYAEGGASAGFGAMMPQGGSGGGGGGRGLMGSQGYSDAAAAQSIIEAQERGELLQLQDDAQYALDGLASAEKAAAASARSHSNTAGSGDGGGRGPRVGVGVGVGVGAVELGSWLERVRESAAALACILATRRGRAALSQPVNLAMKALTSLARLAVVPRDHVTALAAAIILLSLVQEDALPAYGASYAAAVLIRHVLLQAEQDPRPVQQPRQQDGGGRGCNGSAAANVTVSRLLRLVQEGRMARQVGLTGLVMGPLPLVLLAMVVASEAAPARISFSERFKDNLLKVGLMPLLGRLIATRRDAVVRHLNDRRAAAAKEPTSAAATGSAKPAPQPEGLTDTATAVGGGGGDAASGGGLRDPGARGGSAADPYIFPDSQAKDRSQSQQPPGIASATLPPPLLSSSAAAARAPKEQLPLGCFWELQLLLRVLENATFTHKRNENELLALRVCTALPLEHAAAAAAAAAATTGGPGTAPVGAAAVPPPAPRLLRPPSQPTVAASQLYGGSQSLLMGSQHVVCSQTSFQQAMELMGFQKQMDTGADVDATAADGGVPFVAVLVDIVRQLTELMADSVGDAADGGGDPVGSGGGSDIVGRSGAAAPPPAVPVPPSAAALCQVGVAVLMNLTHEHPDGVAAVAAAGGLQAVGGLVWRCCRPRLIQRPQPQPLPGMAAAAAATSQQEQQERVSSGDVGGRGTTASQPSQLLVCRDAIVASIEVLSVGLGLLINMTSHSTVNQRALRAVVLTAAAPPPPSSVPAPSSPSRPTWLDSLPSPSREEGDLYGPPTEDYKVQQDGTARGQALGDDDTSRMVPLLCAVLNAMSRPPGRACRTTAAALGGGNAHSQPGEADGGGGGGGNDNDSGSGSDDGEDLDGDLEGLGVQAARSDAGVDYLQQQKQQRQLQQKLRTRQGQAEEQDKALQDKDEVTESALQEGLQGGQASIAQVYSAILLGYLVAGSDEDEDAEGDTDAGGGGGAGGPRAAAAAAAAAAAPTGTSAVVAAAAAARVEARNLLVGGSLRPVIRGISRCLAFYCRAGAITEGSRDALASLLKRLLDLEAVENPNYKSSSGSY